MSLFTIDEEKCIRCGICAEECPYRLIEAKKEQIPTPTSDAEKYCIECGHCVAVCPKAALTHRMMNPQNCTPIDQQLLPNGMQLTQLLRSRRSIRSYLKKPIPRDLLQRLIEDANYAPTGLNSQAVKWRVIYEREDVGRFAGMTIDWLKDLSSTKPERAKSMNARRWIMNWERGIDSITWGAPHVVVAYADDARWDWECTIALTFLDLAAYSNGVGSCWGGLFELAARDWEPMIKRLALPSGHVPLGAMMLGYAKNKYPRVPCRKVPVVTWY
jgi:nitroreductase/NAD-dependent dihydropyrimidine dehydrogenase PreA subunit